VDRLLQTQVDLIQVSIHGYASSHDKILGIPNAYNVAKNHMETLIEHVNIATNTVITPSNIQSIESMVNDLSLFQTEHGKQLSYVRFVPVLPSGAGIGRYRTDEHFINEVEDLFQRLQNQYLDINFEIPMLHSNPYEYFYHRDKWICPAGSTVAVVRLDGKVIPCNQFLDTNVHSQATVYQKDLQDIWLNDALLSSMRQGIPCASKKMTCKECRYLIMKRNDQLFESA
jgi:radical SAM protein with 4Fe4S-binding SPASM domain